MTRPRVLLDPPPSAERLLPPLLRLSRAIEVGLRSGGNELSLTPAQAEALRFAATVRPDMATVGQLARILGVRHATAVGIVTPLVDRGLLERGRDPSDGRRRILALTHDGVDLVARLDVLTRELASVLGELQPADVAGLERGIGAMLAGLRYRGALVIAAPCAGCVHFRPDAVPGASSPHRCELLRRYLSTAASRMACPEHEPAA